MYEYTSKQQELRIICLLNEDDAKEIVRILHNTEVEKTKYWKVAKTDNEFQVCVSNTEELHPETSSVIVLDNNLDLHQQGYNFRKSKYRVGNLFATYQFMSELLTKKLA